ncbi:MAG: hypothetical protein WC496_06025 [Phycisphaerae bacterium]|jgi:hypothetical protein
MTDKEKVEKLKSFDPAKYNSIDLDRLVIYTVTKLGEYKIELSLENIIVGAFKLFPKKFSLAGYPEFPDATRIEKSLWRCKTKKSRKKQWIGGKTPHGYLITDESRTISSQTEAELSDSMPKKPKKTSTKTRRTESILKETTNSSAYIKYINGKSDSITEADLCYLLQGTLDSTRETLRENLVSLKKFAEELERKDIFKVLCWLEEHFKDFLSDKIK